MNTNPPVVTASNASQHPMSHAAKSPLLESPRGTRCPVLLLTTAELGGVTVCVAGNGELIYHLVFTES